MIKLALCLLLSISPVFSQTEGENSFEYTKRVRDALETIKTIKPENYISKVDKFRGDLEKYIENKKRVCDGEFSTVILGEKPREDIKNKKNKLTREEKKLCFRELKALQITFVNNLYVARKSYVEYLHKERLQELASARAKTIKSLQNSFNKKRKTSKRKR
jgi:hypothetical protein